MASGKAQRQQWCAQTSETQKAVAGDRREQMRVLLVEDDAMIGEAVRDALKDASYAVDWVHDGIRALDTYSSRHYDFVLLDLGLPGRDGIEVMHTIRTGDNPVPVLILTARDGIDDRLCGLDGGADDYIIKPF